MCNPQLFTALPLPLSKKTRHTKLEQAEATARPSHPYLQVRVSCCLLQLCTDDFLCFLASRLLHHALAEHGELGQSRGQLVGGQGLPRSVLPAHGSLSQALQGLPLGQPHRQLLQGHQQRQDGLQARPARAHAQGTQELHLLGLPAGALLLRAAFGQGHAAAVEPVLAQLALQHEAAGCLAADTELDLLDSVHHGHLGQVGCPESVHGFNFLLFPLLEYSHLHSKGKNVS